MSAQHSEGPWRTAEGDNDIYCANGELVSCAYALNMPDGTLKHNETTFANARLIASAPDLLDALQRIADGKVMSGTYTCSDAIIEYQKLAGEAISKARGEA